MDNKHTWVVNRPNLFSNTAVRHIMIYLIDIFSSLGFTFLCFETLKVKVQYKK